MWDLPGSGIDLMSLTLAGRSFTTEPPREAPELVLTQKARHQVAEVFKFTALMSTN